MKHFIRKGASKYLAISLFMMFVCLVGFAHADPNSPQTSAPPNLLDTTAKYTLDISIPTGSETTIPADSSSFGLAEVSLQVSGADVNLENAYLKLEYANNAPARLNPLDFNTSSGHHVSYDGKTITFDTLKGGDKIAFSVNTTFNEGTTPNGYKLPLAVKLYDKNGAVLASSNSVEFQAEVPMP